MRISKQKNVHYRQRLRILLVDIRNHILGTSGLQCHRPTSGSLHDGNLWTDFSPIIVGRERTQKLVDRAPRGLVDMFHSSFGRVLGSPVMYRQTKQDELYLLYTWKYLALSFNYENWIIQSFQIAKSLSLSDVLRLAFAIPLGRKVVNNSITQKHEEHGWYTYGLKGLMYICLELRQKLSCSHENYIIFMDRYNCLCLSSRGHCKRSTTF